MAYADTIGEKGDRVVYAGNVTGGTLCDGYYVSLVLAELPLTIARD